MTKIWMLFDGRYITNKDSSVCHEACDTLQDAKHAASDYGDDTVIVEGFVENNTITYGNVITA